MADLIGGILGDPKLSDLRAAFTAGKQDLDNLLSTTLPAAYALSEAYVQAILDIFYDDRALPGETASQPLRLTAADRERCVIALLASRADRFNLALHIYMGLMLGITAHEIANILLLVGAYTGVDNFSIGLDVEKTTLGVLATVSPTDPTTVFKGLKTAFPS